MRPDAPEPPGGWIGPVRGRDSIPGWLRAARRWRLSLARRLQGGGPLGALARAPLLRGAAERFLRRLDATRIEVCGAPLRLDLLRGGLSRAVYLGGRWHTAVAQALDAQARPGDLAVDAGANVGYMAFHLARAVGPEGRVLAVEPEPRAFARLSENVAAWRPGNLVPVEAALGDHEGEADLAVGPVGGDDRTHGGAPSWPRVRVRTTTIDALAREHGVPAVVKLDIQGAEGAALRGMRETLASPRLRAVVAEFAPANLVAAGEEPAALLRLLREAGLRCASHPEAHEDPAAFSARVLPDPGVDTVWVR